MVLASLPALCQPRAEPPKPPGSSLDGLKIFVLEGAGATNSLVTQEPSMVVVEVRDQNDRPVEGADVTFELPSTGPGGTFAGGSFVRTTRTNAQGQAGVTYAPNPQVGRFDLKVSAKLGDRTGGAVIHQATGIGTPATDERRRAGKLGGKKLALIVGAAAAAGVAILLVTRGSSSSATPPTITLTPGTPTFGSP